MKISASVKNVCLDDDVIKFPEVIMMLWTIFFHDFYFPSTWSVKYSIIFYFRYLCTVFTAVLKKKVLSLKKYDPSLAIGNNYTLTLKMNF